MKTLTCHECDLEEPLDGSKLHNGRLLCEGCSAGCTDPTCLEVDLVMPEDEVVTPINVKLLDTDLTAVVVQQGERFVVSEFAPFCVQPGDVVSVVDGRITAVVEPAESFWVTAMLPMEWAYADVRAKAAALAESKTGVKVEVTTKVTIEISTGDMDVIHAESWLRSLALDSDIIDIELRRTPVTTFDLERAVRAEWSQDTYEAESDFDAWMQRRMGDEQG